MTAANKFTVILDTYYRPQMLKEAIAAIRRQTYENLEIILINNGATPETIELLLESEASDPRVRLLHFEENQFSWDDPEKRLDICLNSALEISTGDYIWHQSDDDVMADDYVEKMVKLFTEDPCCITAAGLTVGLDENGNTSEVELRRSNLRPRHMPGSILVQDIARGGRSLFRSPGEIFSIRRDALIKAGGYIRSLEMSQLYGIVPFGTTGFDETAKFYWRHHQGQLNHQMTVRGLIGIKDTFSMLKEWDIQGRWQVYGSDAAKEIISAVENQVCERAGYCFVHLTYAGKFRGSIRILSRIWKKPRFWVRFAAHAVLEWRRFPLVRWGARPIAKGVIRLVRMPLKLFQESRKTG